MVTTRAADGPPAAVPAAAAAPATALDRAWAHPVLDIVTGLRPTLLGFRDAAETAARPHRKTFDAVGMAGLFRLIAPAEVGGEAVALPVACAVLEELAAVDPSVAWCVWNAFAMARSASWLDPSAARAVYAYPAAYFGFSAVAAATARRVEGGVVVSGRWPVVSGCELASWFELACTEVGNGPDGPDGEVREVRTARFVVVPASAVTIHDTWHVGALRGTGSHAISVSEHFVADAFCIPGEGGPQLAGGVSRIPRYTLFGPACAAIALGIAASALSGLRASAARASLTSGGTIGQRRDVQEAACLAVGALRATRLGYYDAIEALWSGSVGRPPSVAATADAWSAALHALEISAAVVDRCSRAVLIDAISTEFPLEAAGRNIRAITANYERFRTFGASAGRHYLGLDSEFSSDSVAPPLRPTA